MKSALGARVETVSMEVFLFLRGLMFRGERHQCPICGFRGRAFTHGGGSLRTRDRGYCPRCNSKARHRTVWLHCLDHTDITTKPTRLLHVAPKYCLSRRLTRMNNVEYAAVDLQARPHVTFVGDLTQLDIPDETFDGVLCIHVLEHIIDDQAAISEIWRALRPGGWAVINVPVDLDQTTYEDATITTAAGRRQAFGEADHVRVYGADLGERLERAGFEVTLHRGEDIGERAVERHGLTRDEHVFHCVKPERLRS